MTQPSTDPTTSARPLSRRARAWLWTACAAALVLCYLVLWTVYSMTHLSSFPRYDQLPAGASARQLGADFRLLNLVRTEELTAAEGADPQIAAVGAVWVVATLEVVQRTKEPNFVCSTALLGPGRRAWEPAVLDVSRSASRFCSDDELRVGEPFRFEQVFEVPVKYADALYGVVVVNRGDARPQQVLTPT